MFKALVFFSSRARFQAFKRSTRPPSRSCSVAERLAGCREQQNHDSRQDFPIVIILGYDWEYGIASLKGIRREANTLRGLPPLHITNLTSLAAGRLTPMESFAGRFFYVGARAQGILRACWKETDDDSCTFRGFAQKDDAAHWFDSERQYLRDRGVLSCATSEEWEASRSERQ
jgi:hypothetical protein